MGEVDLEGCKDLEDVEERILEEAMKVREQMLRDIEVEARKELKKREKRGKRRLPTPADPRNGQSQKRTP